MVTPNLSFDDNLLNWLGAQCCVPRNNNWKVEILTSAWPQQYKLWKLAFLQTFALWCDNVMLTCTSLASYTQICPNREEAKKSVCFTFSKPDGTPLTAFRKVPEKIGPGKKYRYRKNLVPEKSTGPSTIKNGPVKNYRYRYRRIPGNSQSLYILISSCTFMHWEKENVP